MKSDLEIIAAAVACVVFITWAADVKIERMNKPSNRVRVR
jgi:hypothetical protein